MDFFGKVARAAMKNLSVPWHSGGTGGTVPVATYDVMERRK